MTSDVPATAKPILLTNGECAVCRTIAQWVDTMSRRTPGGSKLIERSIGDDPQALRALNPRLDIWDAYETIHLLMPDGSMKLGGDAVAEVLRNLPNCRWFAWVFHIRVLGMRPFQTILNLSYELLSDVRPLLGCASCGIPSPWVRFVASLVGRGQHIAQKRTRTSSPQFTTLIRTPARR